MPFTYFKSLLLCICLLGLCYNTYAQTDVEALRTAQMSSTRVSQAWQKYTDTLRNIFQKKGIAYPPHNIYLRTFKSQNEMEVWARNNDSSEYKFVKSYRICALSGILGPKRFKGDRQVPEGCYFIDEFNSKSDYYLSMLLSYPNYSDTKLGDKRDLGGDIYIHGGCVTVGCMPMTDPVIQEIYVLCLSAYLNGQNNIPVHIYPVRFTTATMNYLKRTYNDTTKLHFWTNLRSGYDYFEKTHKLLPVMYTPEGKYVF